MDCCYITTWSSKNLDLQVEGIKFEMISMNNVQTPKWKQQSLCFRLEFSLCNNFHCTYYNMLLFDVFIHDGLQFNILSYVMLAHNVDRWCFPCWTILCYYLVMFYVFPSVVHMLFNCALWPPFPYCLLPSGTLCLILVAMAYYFMGFFLPSYVWLLPNDFVHSIIQHPTWLFLVTLFLPPPICIVT